MLLRYFLIVYVGKICSTLLFDLEIEKKTNGNQKVAWLIGLTKEEELEGPKPIPSDKESDQDKVNINSNKNNNNQPPPPPRWTMGDSC